MAGIHTLGFASILILSVILVSYADPGHVHKKHIIHAPLHIKLIHHHKIIKVPVVFRKHLHHHKHLSHEHVYIPLKTKPKPVYEEAEGDHHGDVKGHKPVVVYGSYEGDSGEGAEGGDSNEHYQIHNGGGSGGGHGGYGHGGYGGYGHGGGGYKDKSDEGSYEYDEQQDVGAHSSYQFHGIH